MIEFTCGACGRAYSVPDAAAGKKAKCKCGTALVVPPTHGAAAPAPIENPVAVERITASPSRGAPGEGRGEGSAQHLPMAHTVAASQQPPAAPPVVQLPSVAPQPPASLQSAPHPPTVSQPVQHPPAAPQSAPQSAPRPAPAPPPASGKLPMRTRRLIADAAEMAKSFANFPLIKLKATTGAPPEIYQIEYTVRGLERGKKREPIPRDEHLVEIQLTSDYPRLGPKCRMLTPIFHPNIDPATICVGDHWTAGERLADLVVRIGQMITYQDYNIKSPLDAEAAMWVDLNADKVPVDTRNLYPPDLEG